MKNLPINLLIIFLIHLFFTITPIRSEINFHSEFCLDDVGNYTKGSTYQENLVSLLPSLINKASLSTFGNLTVGQGIDQIFGLYMCRGDLDKQQCNDCVKAASVKIVNRCPVQKEAIVWYQECMLRYANRSIFSYLEEDPLSYTWGLSNVSDPTQFGKVISETMNGIIMKAAYNKSTRGYASDQADVTLLEKVYVFGQCTPDILGSRCERCLKVALRNMGACCGTTASVRMEMYMPSCWVRYAQGPFIGVFDGESDAPTTPVSKSQSGSTQKNSTTSEFINNVANNLPSPSSEATTSTIGGIDFKLGLVLTLTVLLCTTW